MEYTVKATYKTDTVTGGSVRDDRHGAAARRTFGGYNALWEEHLTEQLYLAFVYVSWGDISQSVKGTCLCEGIHLWDSGISRPVWDIYDADSALIETVDPLKDLPAIEYALTQADHSRPISAVLAHDIRELDALSEAQEWLEPDDELLQSLERGDVRILQFKHDIARHPYALARIEHGELTGLLTDLQGACSAPMVALREAEWSDLRDFEPFMGEEAEQLLVWLALSDILTKEM